MWAVNASNSVFGKRLPFQPVLEWRSEDPSFYMPNGYNFAFGAFGDTYVPGLTSAGLSIENTISRLDGVNTNVGALCLRFYFIKHGSVTVALGDRFSVRISRPLHTVNSSQQGLASWVSYITTAGGSSHVDIRYLKAELLDGESVVDSVVVPTFLGSGLFTQVDISQALSCGFCLTDSGWRFFVWLTTGLTTSAPEPYMPHFGCGSAYMSAACNYADIFDNKTAVSMNPAGSIAIVAAAERYGAFQKFFASLPVSPESLVATTGHRAFSMRQPHANFAIPTRLWPNGRPGDNNWQDNGGSFEFGYLPPSSNWQRPTLNDFFPCSAMLYDRNDQASILPDGATGNLHHDAAVNSQLSRLRLNVGPIVMKSGKTLSSGAAVLAPVANVMNCYSGSADVGQGITLTALVGLYRFDRIAVDATPGIDGLYDGRLLPTVTTFEQLSPETDYYAAVAFIVHEGTSQSATSFRTHLVWDSTKEDGFFAGTEDMPVIAFYGASLTAIGPA